MRSRIEPNPLNAACIPIEWNTSLPVYASAAFLASVAQEYGWIGGFDEDAQVRCILPYVVIHKPGFRIVRFQTEVVPLQEEFSFEQEKSFLNNAVEYLRTIGVDMIMPGLNAAVFRTYPDGAVAAPFGTFLLDLRQPEDCLMKNIHSTFRYNIRRATRERVEIKEGLEYLDICYSLIENTLRRSGQSCKGHNQFARSILALGENVKLLVAVRDGACQGCMVAPFSRYAAFTWYCGSQEKPVIGAMHLLHWEAIRRFRAMGVGCFNFQGVRINPEPGSKQEGILNFKGRFGGIMVRGYAWKYSFRILKFAAYELAMRLVRGGDIVDVERYKLAKAS
jgi:hypothetical protein